MIYAKKRELKMTNTKTSNQNKIVIHHICFILFFIAIASFFFLAEAYQANALEVGKSSYFKIDGECFKATVLGIDPVQLKFEASDFCDSATKEGAFLADNECFEVTNIAADPDTFKIEKTDLSDCVGTTYYKLAGNVCFKIEVISFNPTKIKMSEDAKSKCVVNPNTGGSPDSKSSKKSSSSDSSTPLFDDEDCKEELHKQKCQYASRSYNCESYNVKGKFKQYSETCASCSNKMKDSNEKGIDCGGVCTAKCPVTAATPAGAEASDESAITAEPTVEQEPTSTEPSSIFSGWLFPIIALCVLFALIIGIGLWLLFRSRPEEVSAASTSKSAAQTSYSDQSAGAATAAQKPTTAKKKAVIKPKKAAKKKK